jgi:hypothetical protein
MTCHCCVLSKKKRHEFRQHLVAVNQIHLEGKQAGPLRVHIL